MRGFPLSALIAGFRELPLKRRLGICLAALLIVIAATIFFVRRAEHRQTLAEATASLNGAIRARNLEQLNLYVDFDALSRNLADAVLAARGVENPNEDQRRAIAADVQNALLSAFKNASSGEDGAPADDAEEKAKASPMDLKERIAEAISKKEAEQYRKKEDPLSQPVPLEPRPPLLPLDFARQLADKPLRIQGSDGYIGILSTTIDHPKAGYQTPLKLLMRGSSKGWRVIGVSNAAELVALHTMAMQGWRDRVSAAFRVENVRRFDLMNKHYQVLTCRAFLATNLGAKADVPLVVTLEGVNMGRQTLMTAGLICELRAKDGTVLAAVPLNTARSVAPGDAFSQRWQMELSRDLPETQKLMAVPSLTCTTRLSTISLGDGRIVHQQPPSELDKLLK